MLSLIDTLPATLFFSLLPRLCHAIDMPMPLATSHNSPHVLFAAIRAIPAVDIYAY